MSMHALAGSWAHEMQPQQMYLALCSMQHTWCATAGVRDIAAWQVVELGKTNLQTGNKIPHVDAGILAIIL